MIPATFAKVPTGKTITYDHGKRDDLYACRYFNNIFNKTVELPSHVAVENNVVVSNPKYRDVSKRDFRLEEGSDPGIGAYAPSGALWKAGCELENPPDPLPVYRAPDFLWINGVKNACFEMGTLEGWQKTDASTGT